LKLITTGCLALMSFCSKILLKLVWSISKLFNGSP